MISEKPCHDVAENVLILTVERPGVMIRNPYFRDSTCMADEKKLSVEHFLKNSFLFSLSFRRYCQNIKIFQRRHPFEHL